MYILSHLHRLATALLPEPGPCGVCLEATDGVPTLFLFASVAVIFEPTPPPLALPLALTGTWTLPAFPACPFIFPLLVVVVRTGVTLAIGCLTPALTPFSTPLLSLSLSSSSLSSSLLSSSYHNDK